MNTKGSTLAKQNLSEPEIMEGHRILFYAHPNRPAAYSVSSNGQRFERNQEVTLTSKNVSLAECFNAGKES